MATLQEMLSKKIAENKAESLAKTTTPVAPKAPVVSSPTVNPTSTVEKPADFINFEQAKPVSETKAPVPTSITQWVTPKVSVTTPWISEPTKVTPPTTTPKVIWEENWQPIYERKTNTNTTTTPWVTWTDLNLPTAKWTLESPTYSFDVKDPNNYMGTGMTLEQFKTLPLETQSAYTNAALANEQQKQWLIKQVEYATDVTKQKELMEKQRAIKVQTDQLSSENQAIQDNQQVAKARQDLDTLKQNIGFLGQWWRPVQSQQVIDSYDRMLTTSEQQFQDMVKIQNNMKQMRELGIQFDTNAYQAQLDQIHTELKRNVDSVIQDAINGFSADQMSGMIDSPESLQKLQDKYNSMIDQSVMGLTNKSIANLQTMQEVYKGKIATAQQEYQAYQESMAQYQKQQAEQQATFIKNENTLNKDMSEALWYYVNANWKPLMTTEGTTIAVKKDMPAPIFDRESGVMVTFEPDAKGNPVWITKQIMQPSQSAQMELLLKQAQLNKLNTPDAGNRKLQDGVLVNDKTWEIKNTTPWNTTTALDTIKKWEWFRDKAYQDATGTRTLGYWFTNVNWQPVQPWMTMDRATADELLKQEINQRQDFMNYITVPLNENQKAALSSFEFNLWSGIREKNAMPILEKINAWDLKWAGDILKQYVNSKWQKLQWLANRRNEEARLLSDISTTTQVQWWYEPQTAEEEQLLASVSQSKGKKVLPAGTVSMLSDGRALPNLVSDLDKIVTDNESKFWPIAWRVAWWNEYDTSGQNIQSKLKLVSQIVGKFMEWWVLRKEDEVKYEKMLPNLKDSPEVAKSKIENVKNILEQKYKWYIQDYSNNYDVSWFPIKLFWENTPTQQQTTTPPATQQEQNYTPVELQARDSFNW